MINESVSTILHDLQNPNTELLEPGLLSVYRMIIGLQIILVAIAAVLVGSNFPLWPFIFSLSWLVLLFIYLGWPHLHERMGKWFLPPALLVSALMPLLDRVFLLTAMLNEGDITLTLGRIEESSWRTLVFLLFPLALTAWQYPVGRMLGYVAGTFAMTILLTGWLFGWTSLIFTTTLPIAIAQSVLLLLIGYVIYRMISAQRMQRAKLTDANQKLANYAATAEQLATSRERNRLARELHDTLSHTLSALSVQLEAADSVWDEAPEQAHNLLIKSIGNTRSGLAETRRALQALRASPLEDLGLGLALHNLAESTKKRTGLALQSEIPNQIEGLSSAQEQGVYRIAQEALQNVIKHANATSIELSFSEIQDAQNDKTKWLLLIADDGQGFEQEKLSDEGRFGLQGMRERAAMLDAEFEIKSRPGDGTKISMILSPSNQP